MKPLYRNIALSGLLAASAAGIAGCLSMQNQATLDEVQKAVGSPVVEGFIEYQGPSKKWAGPATFMLHVVAKDAGPAQINVSPALFNTMNSITVNGRAPAATQAQPLSGEKAREMLTHLHAALQSADTPYHGCLSPLRVRLVRADGTITEKQGCRSQFGWARATSEATHEFIHAALNGVAVENRAIATEAKATPTIEVPQLAQPAAAKAPAAPAVVAAPAAAAAPVPAAHEAVKELFSPVKIKDKAKALEDAAAPAEGRAPAHVPKPMQTH